MWLSWLEHCLVNRQCWFGSGHIPRLQVQSLVGACKRQLVNISLSYWCFSPTLFPSLPLSLKSMMSLGEKKRERERKITFKIIQEIFSELSNIRTLMEMVSWVYSTMNEKIPTNDISEPQGWREHPKNFHGHKTKNQESEEHRTSRR